MHPVKAILPAGEFEYSGHDLHVELVEAPFASEYVCGPHSTHVPTVEAPTAVEYVPAPQSVQLADPVDSLFFPATHAVHVPPSVPV